MDIEITFLVKQLPKLTARSAAQPAATQRGMHPATCVQGENPLYKIKQTLVKNAKVMCYAIFAPRVGPAPPPSLTISLLARAQLLAEVLCQKDDSQPEGDAGSPVVPYPKAAQDTS